MQVTQSWIIPRQPVWVHKNQQFVKGVIKQIYKQIITCLLQDGDSIKAKKQDIYHRNPMPIDINKNDLMQNDIINQPQILQHLYQRFLSKKIYTYVQNTLIAVNPYTMIPQLYTDDTKNNYIMNIIGLGNNLKQHQPHLYSITAQMVRSLFTQYRNQAIIISGESGAGKTEANKECLRFLTHYFKHLNKQSDPKQSNIQRTIMLSNPILQAFGNSKTIRNNNSSRFGKYLSIAVDSKSKIIKHAQIYNYLLQKSRIISRSKEQQNFHVFYQFLIKTTKNEKIKYSLINVENNKQYTFQDFTYTKNDILTEYQAHPDVSFQKIKQSLTILPDPRSLDYLCRILSAVLHLGNLQPYQDDNLDHCQIMPADTFQTVCELLEIDKKYLFQSLTSYSIKISGQDLVKSFSKREVQQLINSLAKTLYQRLFQWIINEINKSTKSQQPNNQSYLNLGFLDIYGFEVLKNNSLQQLFINYTNQRLHQIYLHKIFKLEKQQFISQKLQHKFRQVNFQDNIKVIQLIDYDNLSIFNLLDQWCAVASPDESTFITKLRFNHKKHDKFPPSNLNLLSTQFMIKHTPQDILYNVAGFREKNKDLLREQIKITMKSSKLKALSEMFTEPKNQNQMDQKAHRVRKFLSSKFRKQMSELVDGLLSKSEQHFIRCIKSNGNKKALEIDEQIVYSQIKYLGILDTIKIKKMGFCIKIKYQYFDKKYSWLVRTNYFQPASQAQITSTIKTFLPRFGEEQLLYGATKIFFKDYAYTIFMKKYSKYYEMLNHRAHQITSLFVKINYNRKKQRKINKKKQVRKYIFGFSQTLKLLKTQKNIKKIQKYIRKFIVQRSQRKKIDSIITIQAYIKRNIQGKLKAKKLNLIEKVVNTFKFLLLKKKVRAKLVADHFVKKILMQRVWKQIRTKRIKTLSKYFNSFKVKVQRKDKILMASINQRNAIEGKSLGAIEYYLLGFAHHTNFRYFKNKIVKLQNNIKTFLVRKDYQRQRNKICLIQRAVRQYLFLKKGAKFMFQSIYKSYEDNLQLINHSMQQKLYDSQTYHCIETNNSLRKFLGKFKQKISLVYFIIDLQAFVDLDLVYPNSSWVNNYLQVFHEGLQKNDPLQYISVGETFTVAANTTKLYLWGMHDNFKNLDEQNISQVKTKTTVQFFQINKNKLNFSYIKEDENEKKNQNKYFKICSTVSKDFNLQNGKLYQCLPNQINIIKGIPTNERILQISCGKSHTILRSTAKKVYTFGYGKQGQLGHSVFASEDKPKSIKFFQNVKPFYPIQVVASFTSSLVLLSNRKMYWFGKNGTLAQIATPTLFEMKTKCESLSGNQFSIGRILSTWSRTLSIIGLTMVCYNGKFENNASMRNKTLDIIFTKWQEAGISNINPPFIPSISDHLEQCHVKLRNKKINIYPQSKTTLKEMQEKARSIPSLAMQDNSANRTSMGTQFSFANTQRNSIFK